jgi:hypothetical protein
MLVFFLFPPMLAYAYGQNGVHSYGAAYTYDCNQIGTIGSHRQPMMYVFLYFPLFHEC